MIVNNSDLLVTGKFGSTYSLKGCVRLYTQNSVANLSSAGVLYLVENEKMHELRVNQCFEQAGKVYISFYGIDTPEEAKRILVGKDAYIDRKFATTLLKGETYCSDLVGLNVTNQGQVVGNVVSWLDATGRVLLEILTPDGKKHIIPYQDVFFAEPDLVKKTIELYNKELLS